MKFWKTYRCFAKIFFFTSSKCTLILFSGLSVIIFTTKLLLNGNFSVSALILMF